MFRRWTMFAKKVYNFQVDQVWIVQVGVVEAFDHLISDDYVNLFVYWLRIIQLIFKPCDGHFAYIQCCHIIFLCKKLF